MNRKSLFIGLVLAGTAMTSQAQSDLSGQWQFVRQESISGKLYSNGSPKQVTIQQEPNSISLTKVTAGMTGDVTTSDKVGVDGKTVETQTASKRRKLIKGSWSSDKRSFVENVEVYDRADSTKLVHKQTDTWSLDNGRLVLDRRDENLTNGEVWESKAYYEKQ